MISSNILPLLHCPLCPPDSPLQHPTTLRCGHTVCAAHLVDSVICPLPVCPPPIPDSRFGINIPSNSTVAYRPAAIPDQPQFDNNRLPGDTRVDVTVSKLIGITSRFNKATAPAPESESEAEEQQTSHRRSHSRPSTGSDSSHTSSRRPAKRRKRNAGPQQQHSPQQIPQPTNVYSSFDKELLTELTCEICFMLYYQPVTTPCQHTFCAKCLHRSLDHNSHCPLCRQDLPDYAFFQDHPYNKVVLAIILKAYPETYAERARVIEEEERDARLDTPIFVCQLSFPGVPTVLHFFEPRYRLMLRRCLESPTPRFGMIMPSTDPSATTSFGTMLQIKSVQMFPDGRSMVYTWGESRFRILEKGSFDGYMVGRIEAIDDYEDEPDANADEMSVYQAVQQYSASPPPPAEKRPPTPPLVTADSSSSVTSLSSETGSVMSASSSSSSRAPSLRRRRSPRPPMTNEALMNKCKMFMETLREGNAPWIIQKMSDSYGPMPTEPASFSFWMALALPIDDLEKAKLLPIKSPRLRLRLVVHWIDQLKSHWWFQTGCTIA